MSEASQAKGYCAMSMDTKDKVGAGVAIASAGYVVWDSRKQVSVYLDDMSGGVLPGVMCLVIGGTAALLSGWMFGRKWVGAGVVLGGLAAYTVYQKKLHQPALPTNTTLPVPEQKLPTGQQPALTGWEPAAATGAGYYVGAILYATRDKMYTLGDWRSEELATQIVRASMPDYCRIRNAGTGTPVFSGGLVKAIDPKGRVTGVSFLPC